MASKSLFNKPNSGNVPVTNTVNGAGGVAYSMTDKHALAQLVITGTFADQAYSTAEKQLAVLKELLPKVDPVFIAKLAVYARESGFMKDSPAALLAHLSHVDIGLMNKVFNRVVDNGKMLLNFVQLVRSGEFGRKSFGNAPKKAIQRWIESRKDHVLFNDSVGNKPSLADVIKMVRPRPASKARAALYGYICGKKLVPTQEQMEYRDIKGSNVKVVQTVNFQDLPEVIQAFENFKNGKSDILPNVSFQMLTSLPLTDKHWKIIAENSSFQQARMNLNTFQRHGVFKSQKMIDLVADKLRNAEEIKKAKVFPYQIMTAYSNVESDMPTAIKDALHDALEIATENVPSFDGLKVYVFPDVSGSMSSSVTGNRGTATSKVRCIDVAALMSATVLRRNKNAVVMPFDTRVHSTSSISGKDSILTNAIKLAAFGGGGTACQVVLEQLNANKENADLLIYVSDDASWVDSATKFHLSSLPCGTPTYIEWIKFKKRNPKAKLVCINIQAETTTQVLDDNSAINIGGFSDKIFETITNFVNSTHKSSNGDVWIKEIENVVIETRTLA